MLTQTPFAIPDVLLLYQTSFCYTRRPPAKPGVNFCHARLTFAKADFPLLSQTSSPLLEISHIHFSSPDAPLPCRTSLLLYQTSFCYYNICPFVYTELPSAIQNGPPVIPDILWLKKTSPFYTRYPSAIPDMPFAISGIPLLYQTSLCYTRHLLL
jgi:hypothetical protein